MGLGGGKEIAPSHNDNDSPCGSMLCIDHYHSVEMGVLSLLRGPNFQLPPDSRLVCSAKPVSLGGRLSSRRSRVAAAALKLYFKLSDRHFN